MTERNVPVQSLIDHIKTAIDVDPWAKEMAEELLKKQEAVKPSARDGANGFSFVWTCGACGKDLHPNNKKAKYCSCCGQAVKWE